MLRLVLGAAIILSAAAAAAQRAPGRDLLNFPLGLAAEPAAFGDGAARGLWNPATALLKPGETARVALSALSAPIDVALSGQVLHGAYSVRAIGTVSLGIARAAIQELVHTETDPQAIGGDIPYSTWVLSAGLARRVANHVDAGVSLRWRQGHVFRDRGGVLAADLGVVAHSITTRDVRLAAATYLWTPGDDDATTWSAAADARIAGADTLRQLRGGLALVTTQGGPAEQYPFAEARYDKVIVRGGPVHIDAYGNATWRLRMAVLLRHGGYTISIAREDNANGLAATYQLGVTSVIR